MDTNLLKTFRIEGGPRERGRAHGELLREPIQTLLEAWGDNLERGYGVDRRRYLDLFFRCAPYERTLGERAPNVLAEVDGIAEGAGVDRRALLAFQHVNEEFEWAPVFARMDCVGEACSTVAIAAAKDRPSIIAQNLDLAQFLDGHQILLRGPCDNSDGEILALSVPGMISLNGLNSFGFAVCDNSLTQLRANPDGVPLFALYRLVLESRSLRQALALIEATPHAVGCNWVMGDPDGVAMIERSGWESQHYGPSRSGDIAFHTNHPLICRDWAPAFAPNSTTRPRPARSTYLRLASLHQRLQGLSAEALRIEAIKNILSARDDADYPVSRGGGVNLEDQQIGFTLACNIFELRRGDPRWHIASGPPHCTAFREFGFD